jgi:hypothetical protein
MDIHARGRTPFFAVRPSDSGVLAGPSDPIRPSRPTRRYEYGVHPTRHMHNTVIFAPASLSLPLS